MAPEGLMKHPTREPIRAVDPPRYGPSKMPIRGPPAAPKVIVPATPIVMPSGNIVRIACRAANIAVNDAWTLVIFISITFV